MLLGKERPKPEIYPTGAQEMGPHGSTSDRVRYMRAVLGASEPLPFGLIIWAPDKVLNIEWGDDGAVNLVRFRRDLDQLRARAKRAFQQGN